MRKGRDGKRKKKEKKEKKEKKKRMPFLVATTSLPAVYRPNSYARTTTAGMPHARAKILLCFAKVDSFAEHMKKARTFRLQISFHVRQNTLQ